MIAAALLVALGFAAGTAVPAAQAASGSLGEVVRELSSIRRSLESIERTIERSAR